MIVLFMGSILGKLAEAGNEHGSNYRPDYVLPAPIVNAYRGTQRNNNNNNNNGGNGGNNNRRLQQNDAHVMDETEDTHLTNDHTNNNNSNNNKRNRIRGQCRNPAKVHCSECDALRLWPWRNPNSFFQRLLFFFSF